MKALSIRQPWADMILKGFKPWENRTWRTFYRGPLLIHASKSFDAEGAWWIRARWKALGLPIDERPSIHGGSYGRGGIVGAVTLRQIVSQREGVAEELPGLSWLDGPFGWRMDEPRRLPFTPWKGRLNLFEVPAIEVVRALYPDAYAYRWAGMPPWVIYAAKHGDLTGRTLSTNCMTERQAWESALERMMK